MLNFLMKKLTKNYSKVPLFNITFDLNKYKKDGASNSCMVGIHPDLKNDEYLQQTLYDLIDYIRKNYDMEKVSKLN